MPRGNPDMEAMRNARLSPEERFWAKVVKEPGGCWNWTGYVNPSGYAQIRIDKKAYMVHRYSWYLRHGAWPQQVIDHICRNQICVNPDHLQDIHPVENSRLAHARGRKSPKRATYPREDKTRCRSGLHSWESKNIINSPNGPQCRACVRERARERYHARHHPTE